MGALFDVLLQKAASELTNDAGDKWADNLITALKSNVSKIPDVTVAAGAAEAISVLEKHKDDIAGMGNYTLALFLQQLALGNVREATLTYIKNQANPQELIDGMNKGADGIIAAKKKLDEIEQTALGIAKDLAITAARFLLPLVLSLI